MRVCLWSLALCIQIEKHFLSVELFLLFALRLGSTVTLITIQLLAKNKENRETHYCSSGLLVSFFFLSPGGRDCGKILEINTVKKHCVCMCVLVCTCKFLDVWVCGAHTDLLSQEMHVLCLSALPSSFICLCHNNQISTWAVTLLSVSALPQVAVGQTWPDRGPDNPFGGSRSLVCLSLDPWLSNTKVFVASTSTVARVKAERHADRRSNESAAKRRQCSATLLSDAFSVCVCVCVHNRARQRSSSLQCYNVLSRTK